MATTGHSKVRQGVNLDPKVPFLNNLLEASAGFQNYIEREVTATNFKSFGFLDH